MINWIHKEDEVWEGVFKSSIFHDEEDISELSIGIENASLADYAEKCVNSLNTMPEQMVIEICKGIIECAEQEQFKIPKLDSPLDILKYCWFTTVYVGTPNRENLISYVVEGEGDWGEVIGFAIENNQLVYVGVDYYDYINSEK